MANERRRSPRFSVRHLIEMDFGKETFVRATGVNISSSGLLCKTEPPIDLYTRVFLSLTVPGKEGDEVINCEGIVVRCDETDGEHLTAIVFTGFRPEESEKLMRLLDESARQGARPQRRNAKA